MNAWQVMQEIETLSDHRYVFFTLDTGRCRLKPSKNKQRRWNLKKFNKDLFLATLAWHEADLESGNFSDLNQSLAWLDRVIVEACDSAAPRIGPAKPRRQCYWWNDDIATLRHNCMRTRQNWSRAKSKGRTQELIDELGGIYKAERNKLRKEINKSKSKAWQELIGDINKDPWGLPYKIVMEKIRSAAPALTELLEPDTLGKVLDSLFPIERENNYNPNNDWGILEWDDEWLIQPAEIIRVQKRTVPSSKAPGPDGIKASV